MHGKAKVGVDVKRVFRDSKASWVSSVQENTEEVSIALWREWTIAADLET